MPQHRTLRRYFPPHPRLRCRPPTWAPPPRQRRRPRRRSRRRGRRRGRSYNRRRRSQRQRCRPRRRSQRRERGRGRSYSRRGRSQRARKPAGSRETCTTRRRLQLASWERRLGVMWNWKRPAESCCRTWRGGWWPSAPRKTTVSSAATRKTLKYWTRQSGRRRCSVLWRRTWASSVDCRVLMNPDCTTTIASTWFCSPRLCVKPDNQRWHE